MKQVPLLMRRREAKAIAELRRPIVLLLIMTSMNLPGCGGAAPEPQVADAEPTRDSVEPVAASTDGSAPPEMSFSHTSHDFGIVSDTRQHTHTFDFVNTGGSDLTIKEVKTSCGCTSARALSEHVAPGEKGQIEVTYDPRGVGVHRYTVTVAANTKAPSQLAIKAEVDPFVVMKPARLEWGTMALNEPHTALVTVLCADPDMSVESIRVNHPQLSAEILGDDPAVGDPAPPELSGRSVIKLVLDGDAPWGEFQTTCVITATGTPDGMAEPIEHTKYLPISALIFGELQARPPKFRLGVLAPGEPFERSIRLYRISSAPFQIREVTVTRSNLPGVNVRAEPSDENGLPGYRITLSADPAEYLGTLHGAVRVVTDVAGEGANEIPFSGIFRDRG